MIEALTPWVLFIGLLQATIVASLLTLLVSLAVLLAYRRRVLHEMAARSAAGAQPWPAPKASDDSALPIIDGVALAEFARGATRRAAWEILAAGAAFAIVFAVAATLAFPPLRTAGRFLLVLWVCSWPVVPALLMTVPARRRTRLLWIASPFLLWALVSLLQGAATSVAPQTFGRTAVEYFYTITPPQALGGWMLANAAPTLMWWLFSNRRLRAIGSLILGFATALAAGGVTLLTWLVLTSAGTTWLAGAAAASSLSQSVVVLLLLFLLLAVSLAAGWGFMLAARRAYRRKRANDCSLILDALWLLFAIWYSMGLVLAGPLWLGTAVLAFGSCRLVLRETRRRSSAPPAIAPSLVFLRVFSLGRRSDQLFDRITSSWRYLANVDLICGPDIVHTTVQPHQLMDFLAGRLSAHFIDDPASLERRLAERDLLPDSDGRYRVNSFFCHADTWTRVMPALLSGTVVVLMDLRSLSDEQSGCARELHHLVAAVPLGQCVLVVDSSTDRPCLQRTLASAWRAMPADSPNRSLGPDDIPLHQLTSDEGSVRALLLHLCAAAQGAGAPEPTR